jgi:hypothetical protein
MKLLVLVLLLWAFAPQSSTSVQTEKPAKTELLPVFVSGPTWEPGELRLCSTYSTHPKVMLCDEHVRVDLRVGYVNNAKIDRDQFITSLWIKQSKRFKAQFSQFPWKPEALEHNGPSDEPPLPDQNSPNIESDWDCEKDKTITCSFVRSLEAFPR